MCLIYDDDASLVAAFFNFIPAASRVLARFFSIQNSPNAANRMRNPDANTSHRMASRVWLLDGDMVAFGETTMMPFNDTISMDPVLCKCAFNKSLQHNEQVVLSQRSHIR
jgi:hypothetical protein